MQGLNEIQGALGALGAMPFGEDGDEEGGE